MISLDLAARRVIMSSMLYYGLDKPVLSDAEFDDLCRRVADNWNMLSEQRRICLGSPDEIRTTGVHVKITTQAEGAAIDWLVVSGLYSPDGPLHPVYTKESRILDAIGRYRLANEYSWEARTALGEVKP